MPTKATNDQQVIDSMERSIKELKQRYSHAGGDRKENERTTFDVL